MWTSGPRSLGKRDRMRASGPCSLGKRDRMRASGPRTLIDDISGVMLNITLSVVIPSTSPFLSQLGVALFASDDMRSAFNPLHLPLPLPNGRGRGLGGR